VARPAIPWFEAEPKRLELEKGRMAVRAPEMSWVLSGEYAAGAWEGVAPKWPFEREEPDQLSELLPGSGLRLRVEYLQGFPAQPPWAYPLDPEPDSTERLSERLHLNGDGSLCLIRSPADWRPWWSAADIVDKAASWCVWYLAVKKGLAQKMPPTGIYDDAKLDEVLGRL
jgi:hypothetical protein